MNVAKKEAVSCVTLRLPPDLKDWLASRAGSNRRSGNAEIVQILETARLADSGARQPEIKP